MTHSKIRIAIYILFFLINYSVHGQNKISLAGYWQFKTDSTDVGQKEQWFNKDFAEKIIFPGSMNTNGKGEDVTVETKWTGSLWNKEWYTSDFYKPYRAKENTKIVFWLTPNKVYTGVAWYRREVDIPANWSGKNILISFERCHWETSIWFDGNKIGTQNSLSTPHRYILQKVSKGKHTISLRIDNRIKDIDPGVDAHSISDNTQTNWNGIIGSMIMQIIPEVYIRNIRLFPDKKRKIVRAEILLCNITNSDKGISINLQTGPNNSLYLKNRASSTCKIQPGDSTLNITVPMIEKIKNWDEFSPNLYLLKATVKSESGIHERSESFGFRELTTNGTQITINGNSIFLRGTLECCVFPKTGFPATDKASWERIFRIAKSYGLNHFRFHSWCPPKAAFDAADQLGIYFQIECDSWSGNLGSGLPIDKYIIDESKRIVNEFGNHPSFCLLAYGNEPYGPHHKEFLTNFVNDWKKRDTRFLYTSAAGWPSLNENNYQCIPAPRIQAWGEGNKSLINDKVSNSNFNWNSKISKNTPTIGHEIGQWCAYPNLKERSEYTGVLKAKNFDIFEDRLKQNNILCLADSFLLASGKLQTLCYKADIEAALRTEGFAGFQMLGLTDFPGQGTALVGVLNPFWKEKGYVTAKEFNRFCNQTVPLLCMDKFIFKSGDTLYAKLKVAHFGKINLINPKVKWSLIKPDGQVVYEEILRDIKEIQKGKLSQIAVISKEIVVEKPVQYKIEVSINGIFKNSWNIWIYPEIKIKNEGDVIICTKLNDSVLEKLNQGAKVLFTPTLGTLKNESKDSVVVGFSSIFWNTLWTNNQAPHTLGILCNPRHPVFDFFPTEYYSNYQWQDILKYANAIALRKFPDKTIPIIRIIDDWFKGRSLALALEVKVGKGKLFISGADLQTDLINRPASRQFLFSIMNYMQSPKFNPKIDVDFKVIKSLCK